jgi:hypothetical protein
MTTAEAEYVVAHRELYTVAWFTYAIEVLERAGRWPR